MKVIPEVILILHEPIMIIGTATFLVSLILSTCLSEENSVTNMFNSCESYGVTCCAMVLTLYGIAGQFTCMRAYYLLSGGIKKGVKYCYTICNKKIKPFTNQHASAFSLFLKISNFILIVSPLYLLSLKLSSVVTYIIYLVILSIPRIIMSENTKFIFEYFIKKIEIILIRLLGVAEFLLLVLQSLFIEFGKELRNMRFYSPFVYSVNFLNACIFMISIYIAGTLKWELSIPGFHVGMFFTLIVITLALNGEPQTYWRNSYMARFYGVVYMITSVFILIYSGHIGKALLSLISGAFIFFLTNSINDPPQCREYHRQLIAKEIMNVWAKERVGSTEREIRTSQERNERPERGL